MRVGVGWGVLNGVLIALLDIPPLIVTLGSFGAALGLSDVLTGGVDLSGVPNEFASTIGQGSVGPIPVLVLIAGIVTIVLRPGAAHDPVRPLHVRDRLKRRGRAARRHQRQPPPDQGLRARRPAVGPRRRAEPRVLHDDDDLGPQTDNLTAIAAVVIGGTSLFGGVGAMAGTVVGVFIPVVLASGLVIVGVQSFWQQVMIGVILVAAVYFDQLRRRARLRR